MSRLGSFSDETLAVESIFEDIGLLEKWATRGESLCDDALYLLMQCNSRLSRLLQELSAGSAPARPCESYSSTDVTSANKALEESADFQVNAA